MRQSLCLLNVVGWTLGAQSMFSLLCHPTENRAFCIFYRRIFSSGSLMKRLVISLSFVLAQILRFCGMTLDS